MLSALDGATARSRADEAEIRWLRGIAYAATGRYAAALAVLDPADPRESAVRGSVYRQLEAYAAAKDADALATSAGDPEVRFDGLLGLAADAVGAADAALATARLDAAVAQLAAGSLHSSCTPPRASAPSWRPLVRLAWVRTEIALLGGDPAAASVAARAAVTGATAAGAPRHLAKSLLFAGVARAETGAADAVPLLRRAAALADRLGCLPVVWPSHLVLARLVPEAAIHRALAGQVLESIAANAPGELVSGWASAPDVRSVGDR